MRIRSVLALVSVCGASLAAAADPASVVKRTVTLRECIDLALQHNLELQVRRFDPQIARYRLRAAYGIFYPNLTLDGGRYYVDEPERFDPKKVNPDRPYRQTVDTAGGGIGGLLPFGLTYNVYARHDNGQFNTIFTPTQVTNEYYTTSGFELTLPLLRNLWIDAGRRDIQLAKKDLKISEATLRGAVMTNVTAVVEAYYELIYAREAVKVQRKGRDLAQRLLDETRVRVKAGDLAPLSEKQAESLVETVQTAVFSAEQLYAEQQIALKTLLGDDFAAWMDVELEPADALIATEQSLDRFEAWRRALLFRPDMQALIIEEEKRGVWVKYDKNQLLPKLDVVGGFGVQSPSPSETTSINELGTYPFYSVAAKLVIPLGNVTARNNLKASQLALKQAETRVKRKEQNILAEVDSAVMVTESAFKRVGSTRKAREFAEAALAAEEQKLQTSATTPFLVQEFQRNVTAARTAEARALVDYIRALARLEQAEGSTLERHRISLNFK